MLDLLDINTAKQWLRLDSDDTEEDITIDILCKNAEIYVKKGVGEHYKATEENTMQSKLIAMILVTNWYENRDFSGTVEHIADKARRTVEGLILQLQLSIEEDTQ